MATATTQTDIAAALAENDQLRCEIADLREQLEIERSKPLSDCPVDRTPWTFHFTTDGLLNVRQATGQCDGTDHDADKLSEFCRRCLAREQHDRAEVESAKNLGHKGLEYLATEANWLQILGLGRYEAMDFVEEMSGAADQYAVNRVTKDFLED